MTTERIITSPIDEILVIENAVDSTLDLFNNFDDPFTTGLVAHFQLVDRTLGNGGLTNVVLFDQAGQGAPLAVQNFLNYVGEEERPEDYINTIIHRSVPSFVIQGGGFTVENLSVNPVPPDPPVQNQFSAERSNLRGTIALARLGGQPNSATSQWFFNLSDNSFLDDVDEGDGFTVFGEVVSEVDLEAVDAIAALPVFNATGINPAFGELPLIVDDPANPVIEQDDNFVRYESITVTRPQELAFSIVNNSNPNLVDVSLDQDQGQLVLDYLPGVVGSADITVSATNLLGNTIEETFTVTALEHADNGIEDADLPAIVLGEEITSNIGTDLRIIVNAADIDFYRFTPTEDGVADLSITEGSTNLRLFNAVGDEIANNNDSNSFIRFGVIAGQDYFIGVNGNSENANNYDPLTGSGAENGTEGDYSISLTGIPDFPWDIDEDNLVTATDVLFAADSLGSSRGEANYDPLADLDGNGLVTPTDAIAFINRLGTSEI